MCIIITIQTAIENIVSCLISNHYGRDYNNTKKTTKNILGVRDSKRQQKSSIFLHIVIDMRKNWHEKGLF